jgi:hypothetical protein
MIDRIENEERQRSYKSYEEYLRHFYGAKAGEDSTRLSLEASFGKRLARRVLEVEGTEKIQRRIGPASP